MIIPKEKREDLIIIIQTLKAFPVYKASYIICKVFSYNLTSASDKLPWYQDNLQENKCE